MRINMGGESAKIKFGTKRVNFVSNFFFLVSIISTPDLIFLFEERDVSDF